MGKKSLLFLFSISMVSTVYMRSPVSVFSAGGPPPIPRTIIHYRTTASATTQVGNLSSPGDFNALMTGQGHSINVMGSTATDFIQNAKTRGTQLIGNVPNIDSNLNDIYQRSIASNINPAIVLTIWGVMSHFSLNGSEFGRSPSGSGFNVQLSQAVSTLNNWMIFFNQNQKSGSYTIPNTNCTYADEFIFAYEKFTPFCSVNNGNDTQANFINYYKIFTNQ